MCVRDADREIVKFQLGELLDSRAYERGKEVELLVQETELGRWLVDWRNTALCAISRDEDI